MTSSAVEESSSSSEEIAEAATNSNKTSPNEHSTKSSLVSVDDQVVADTVQDKPSYAQSQTIDIPSKSSDVSNAPTTTTTSTEMVIEERSVLKSYDSICESGFSETENESSNSNKFSMIKRKKNNSNGYYTSENDCNSSSSNEDQSNAASELIDFDKSEETSEAPSHFLEKENPENMSTK